MALPLSQLPQEVVREVRSRKWQAFFLFAVVSFAVLAAGFLWPYKYESEVVIFVDDSNIIEPLMEGRAVTTKINERAESAEEMLLNRSVLRKVATDESLYDEVDLSEAELEGRIAQIRGGISVRPRSNNFFSIGFASGDQREAFKVAQRLGQLFIEETRNRKRSESRGAYEFIDRQVKSYEEQLADVEGRMKEFLSEHKEGTEDEANRRMADLRGQLELAELEEEELKTRESSLQSQLEDVGPTIREGRSEDAYRDRIRSLEERLDSLRLQYHDSYPDIVNLRKQISELEKQRESAAANPPDVERRSLSGTETVNPLYQELSASLSETRANLNTIQTRIRSLEDLISRQSERMEKIQANKAEYSELTRDMEVNKDIYDDLLKRREKARISMSLDVDGQGMNFKINQAAQYPRKPSGPQFFMFASAGLLLGLVAPFGAVAGLLQVDPRIRAREQFEESVGLPVLVEIPDVRTPYEKRRDRRQTLAVGLFSLIAAAAYVAIVVMSGLGVI